MLYIFSFLVLHFFSLGCLFQFLMFCFLHLYNPFVSAQCVCKRSITVHTCLLGNFLNQIQSYMAENRCIALRTSQTEFLRFGTPPGRYSHTAQLFRTDLGVAFDLRLSFNEHFNFICRSTHYQIPHIFKIRHHILFLPYLFV